MACISSLTKATTAAIKLASTHTGTDSDEQEAAGTAQQRGTAEPGNSVCQAGQSLKAGCKYHQPIWEFRPHTVQPLSTQRGCRRKGKVWVCLKSLSPFLIEV